MARAANRKTRRSVLRPPLRRPAIVLVLVLVVVAMVALAGFSFAELMLTENKATHLHGDSLVLEQAMGSAVESIKLFCEQPAQVRALAGGSENNPTLFRAIPLSPEEGNARRTTARQTWFSVVAPASGPFGAAPIRFGLEDESGRLHLADILRWEQQQPGLGRNALLKLPGMTETIADAILDWIDADSQPSPQGAEREYYAGQPSPYAPRNALPENLEELLLVKGVTRELLFGADANYSHEVDEREMNGSAKRSSRAAPSGQAPETPWISLLTLHSGRRNLTSEGAPRIDLNGADLTQLNQQLTAALGATWAGFIVAMRQYGPYGGPDPGTPDPIPVNASTGARYVFSSALELVGARVAVPSSSANQPAKVYASPLASETEAAGPELAKLLDKTTTIAAPVIRGGVSVNHAPRDVLRAVPGMDDALADRIVAARAAAQGSQDAASRAQPTWLLRDGLVDLGRMKLLMPNVCGEGDVVRAEVIGHFRPRGQTIRAEVLIDATTVPARQVAWKDLRLFGTAYPAEWFDDDEPAAGSSRSRATQRDSNRPPASPPAPL